MVPQDSWWDNLVDELDVVDVGNVVEEDWGGSEELQIHACDVWWLLFLADTTIAVGQLKDETQGILQTQGM